MITVTIAINDQVIIARSATRRTTGDVNTYHVDDGRTLTHRYGDGAIPLAIAMLTGVEEP